MEEQGARYPRQALKTFLLVAFLGPLPFAVLLFLVSIVTAVFETGLLLPKGASTLLSVFGVLIFIVIITYIYGGLCAILAGVISGIRIYFNGVLSILELLGIATLSGFAGSLVWFKGSDSPYAMGSPLIMTGIAVLCALLFIPLLRRKKILR